MVAEVKAKITKQKKKSIKQPLTVGEKLAIARKKMGINLLDAERKTLIRAKYLEAMEQSKYYQLPLPVYTIGFVQTYATFLGLNPKRILQQFQQEYGLANQSPSHHLVLESRINPAKMIITPKLLWRSFAAALVIGLVAYFAGQIANFAGTPTLAIDSPHQQAEVNGDTVTVSGTTDPGTVVSIGEQRIPVAEDGRFVQDMRVNQGVIKVTVKAENRLGRSRVVTRVVKVNPPTTAFLPFGERVYEQN